MWMLCSAVRTRRVHRGWKTIADSVIVALEGIDYKQRKKLSCQAGPSAHSLKKHKDIGKREEHKTCLFSLSLKAGTVQ